MGDKLTKEQAQAVHDRGGKLLVSAAAGSGKTKVLVDRLLSYLTDPQDPANLDDFLIITYTKAAASELRGKIAAKLTERIAREPENRHLQKQMQRLFLTKISTVHGFCGDILREYAYRLDIESDFRVADENECRELRVQVLTELLDRAYQNVADNPDFRVLIDTQGLGRDDRLVPEIIQKVYDSARCHLNPTGWLDGCLNSGDLSDVTDVSQTPWGRFLIEDLQDYLNCQIRVLGDCASRAEALSGLEKQALNLRSTILQMESLRNAKTWDEIVSGRGIEYGRLVFPKKNNPDPELAEQIKALRDACKEGLKRKLNAFTDNSEQILADMAQTAAGIRALVELVKQFDRDYTSAKRSRRCLDFSDLEHKTLDLLLGKSRSNPTAAASEIGRRYREILVDEYQDSNGVQDAIFSALSREKQNCFLVGDVKQSIYQFRLADPGIFLEKYHTYLPVAEAMAGQGRKVLLSHNFRSGPEILSAVNHVFRTCMRPKVGGLEYGDAESLREGIAQAPLPDPAVELHCLAVQESGYAEEAAFVAQKIEKMLKDGSLVRKDGKLKPVEPEDIVILLRSPGSAGGVFQQALEKRGIRCTSGGSMDLLQTEEIGTLRSMLQTILNPRQDIPLISTLASPVFAFTADELAQIRGRQKRGSIYDALCASDSDKVKSFLAVLDALRKEARQGTLTGLLQRCFTLTQLDSVYAAMPGGEARSANLQAFYELAANFEKTSLRDLSQFLEHLAALEDRGLLAGGAAAGGSVTIMSIHKSKGLEFPVVFLCNLSRKFNQEDLRAQILCDKELGLGLSIADAGSRIRYPSAAKRAIAVKMAAQSVSEELRVLYVAMTRARDRLIMTYASRSLESDLMDIVLRQDADNGELLCREALCLGDWVLMAALRRTEAGELFALAGRPAQTQLGEHPWLIRLGEAAEEGTAKTVQDTGESISAEELSRIREALAFHYPYAAAVEAPSKQTATGRKGRQKDAEAAENAKEESRPQRTWRQPSFRSGSVSGKTYGSAIHAALQYLRYECCGSEEQVADEVRRLVSQGFLTKEQGELVNCGKIAVFFQTEIGKKLIAGTSCLREFKFSILDEGENYGDGLEGEKVLLQGVVDCALLEPDGITVLDFKTDYVTEESLAVVTERYRPQVEAYGEALSRICQMPVKEKFLYFFHMDRFSQV